MRDAWDTENDKVVLMEILVSILKGKLVQRNEPDS